MDTLGGVNDSDGDVAYFLAVGTLAVLTVFFARYIRASSILRRPAKWTSNNLRKNAFGLLVLSVIALFNFYIWFLLFKFFLNTRSTIKVGGVRVLSDSPLNSVVLSQPFNEFRLPGYSFIERDISFNNDYDKFDCNDVLFEDTLEAMEKIAIPSDMKQARDLAKKMAKGEYPGAKYALPDEKGESEKSILNTKWNKFAGSSTWLPKYGVHFFVSRVTYSAERARNKPTISLLHAQIYDQNWNQLHVNLTVSSGKMLQFPTYLKIPVMNPKRLFVLGAEDPRVILRRFKDSNGKWDEEPVVIFNKRADANKRFMHMIRPFHDDEEIVKLSLRGKEPRFREKNWAPLFDEDDQDHIYFVYNFNPLRIVKCGLDVGLCDKVTGPDFVSVDADASTHVGSLRGGTDLVPIPPSALPAYLNSRRFWFGIARSHIDKCGCLNEIYRPHAFIVSKNVETGVFALDYVSSLVDFNVITAPWKPKAKLCDDGKSVLIPNSISYWNFLYDDYQNIVGDVMGLTLSEGDRTNVFVQVKGFFAHVLAAFNINDNKLNENITKALNHLNSEDRTQENMLLGKCSTSLSDRYCRVRVINSDPESSIPNESFPLRSWNKLTSTDKSMKPKILKENTLISEESQEPLKTQEPQPPQEQPSENLEKQEKAS